jgi:Sulfotransferase family
MTASAELSAAALARARRSPDFFIVGHPKCGTTALYEMLRAHPGIYMPDLKEPWFLASDMLPRFPPPRSASPPETLEDYLALFSAAGPEQRIGEASSSYLLSRTAAASIAELRPDARVIAILREPASFLRSLHLQLLRTHVEAEKDFGRAIELEALRRRGKKVPRRSHRPQLLLYSDHVRYVEQLRRYRGVLPSEQILVLIYDDFRRDNEATVRSVLRFLGLDHEAPIALTDANPTRQRMRSQQLDELVNIVSVGRGPASRALKAAIKALTTERLRDGALRVTRRHVILGKPGPADERLMRELRGRFKDEVVALSEYLDRDLVSLWGYDSGD